MSKYLRSMSKDDLQYVAMNMRSADRGECYAAVGADPKFALTLSCMVSEDVYSLITPTGAVAGMCGISVGHTPGDKQVWMLGTDDIFRHRFLFQRESHKWLDELNKKYLLWNYVDERNKLHMRWLKSVGAVFYDRFYTSPYTGTRLQLFTRV